MTRRLRAGMLATLLAATSVPLTAAAAFPETAEDLAALFEELGLETAPGLGSHLLENGAAGVFRGAAAEDDSEPYVLVISDAPSAITQLAVLARLGREGQTAPYRIPPVFGDLGRHIALVYQDREVGGAGEIIPLEKVAARLDLSGMDRWNQGRLLIRAVGSSTLWPRLIERTNIPLGFDLELVDNPDLGSSRAAEAYRRGVPGLEFATHAEDPDDAQLDGIVAAALFPGRIAAAISRLDEPPPFQRVERRSEADKPKAVRPYTGTVPAYTADVEGLLLEGVLEGGPAEEAGLQAGDVIVELAGSAIEDVYTYADVLDSLEIDVAIAVVFLRDGERRETTLTPRGR